MKKTHKHPVDATGNSIPVVVLRGPGPDKYTFEIHAYRAGQECQIQPQATMRFGAPRGPLATAGIVYVSKGPHGVRADDDHVDNQTVWDWVQEWMQKGMDADKLGGLKHALERIANRTSDGDYRADFEQCVLVAKETLAAVRGDKPMVQVAPPPQLRLTWDGEKRDEWHALEGIVERKSATTRAAVAELVMCLGFTAYICGRHVAVHTGPGPNDPRIGYFTSSTLLDFN